MSDELGGGASAVVLGRILELTPRRIQQLAAEGIIPKVARGKYPLVESIRGYVRWLKKQLEERNLHIAPQTELAAKQGRLADARAALAEIEAQEKRRSLVPATDQDHVQIALATVITARLRAIAPQRAQELAIETDPPRCKEIVETAIDEALHDLAEAARIATARVAAAGEPAIH